jgi:hypothetical protein
VHPSHLARLAPTLGEAYERGHDNGDDQDEGEAHDRQDPDLMKFHACLLCLL